MIKHVSNKIQNAIQMELFKAKESIKIAVAWFTNELFLQPLILKLQNGVSVELILNDDEINRGGESSLDFTEFLQAGGILRWNNSKQLMHEKFCVIDNRIVITGSYNWTNKAEYNSEVESIFYDEDNTTLFYNELFSKLSISFEKEANIVTSPPKDDLSKTKSNSDEDNFFIDELGVKYSKDKKRLISVPGDRVEYCSLKDVSISPSGKCPASYSIPNGVTDIESGAFQYCASLISVHIPESVTNISGNPFYGCTSLKSIVVDSNNKYYDSRNNCNAVLETKSDTLLIACISTVIPDGTKCIATSAFRDSKWNLCDLISIHIPDSVKIIEKDAFWNCNNLKFVHIPDNIISIGEYAFCGCESLVSIRIPHGVKFIENGTFLNCKRLKSIHIPNSVTGIGEYAFYGCESLKYFRIPEGVTTIGEEAFRGCNRLDSVVIPQSVTSIGKRAFYCLNLRNVYIPYGTKSKFKTMLGWDNWLVDYETISLSKIEDWENKVSDCELENAWTDEFGVKYSRDRKWLLKAPNGITNYSIRKGTTVIYNNAFRDCKTLTAIHIPNSVKRIGDSAFACCTDLESVHIPESTTSIGRRVFVGCIGLKFIAIPNGIKTIGQSAFLVCKSLVGINDPYSVLLPEGVKSIENSAFRGCSSLAFIYIPNSVTNIGIGAFSRCDALKFIYIPKGTKSKFESMLPEDQDKLVEVLVEVNDLPMQIKDK